MGAAVECTVGKYGIVCWKERTQMTGSMCEEDRLNELARKATEAHPRYGNCAQAPLSILQEQFGLDHVAILKALEPSPGIALRGETCGAVIGYLMAIGLVFESD